MKSSTEQITIITIFLVRKHVGQCIGFRFKDHPGTAIGFQCAIYCRRELLAEIKGEHIRKIIHSQFIREGVGRTFCKFCKIAILQN